MSVCYRKIEKFGLKSGIQLNFSVGTSCDEVIKYIESIMEAKTAILEDISAFIQSLLLQVQELKHVWLCNLAKFGKKKKVWSSLTEAGGLVQSGFKFVTKTVKTEPKSDSARPRQH